MTDATGRVRETYSAALQHDLVDLDGDEHLLGVVRRPTGWFRGQIDENRPELGPPEDLLDEVKDEQEALKLQGMCDEGAHNAAWENADFEARYREYVDGSSDAQAALDSLADRVRDGETIVLVCFEGDNKRCHRHALVETLRSRVDEEK
ncbi:MAG: DUF488 family protein [Haloarculaceae archaeon]